MINAIVKTGLVFETWDKFPNCDFNLCLIAEGNMIAWAKCAYMHHVSCSDVFMVVVTEVLAELGMVYITRQKLLERRCCPCSRILKHYIPLDVISKVYLLLKNTTLSNFCLINVCSKCVKLCFSDKTILCSVTVMSRNICEASFFKFIRMFAKNRQCMFWYATV
jgi:hypothetical protein